jgi:hypothetical protein
VYPELDKAFNALVAELNSDSDYRRAWQDNIAMAFKDACAIRGIEHDLLHEAANEGANRFLSLLCWVDGRESMQLETGEK